jgi:hypothetical protein
MRVTGFIASLLVLILFTSTLQAQYAGSQTCLACHSGIIAPDKTSWRATFHHKAYADPNAAPGVVPHDAFAAGLDLAADPDFSAYSSAPVLGFDPGAPTDSTDFTSGYSVTIGSVTYTISRTNGGMGWKQRYHTKIGNSTYVLPIQYNLETQDWVTYDPSDWYDSNGDPIYTDPGTLEDDINLTTSTERRCDGCHVTGLDLQWNAQGDSAYTATFAEVGVGCEMCHTPYDGGSGHGFNPGEIEDTRRANEVCGQCHNRGASIAELGGNTMDYPWSDAGGFEPTDDLSLFFDSVDPTSASYWPDQKHGKQNRMQLLDFYMSPKPTYAYHEVRCWECHNPHGSANEHMIVEEIIEIVDPDTIHIPTEPDNNTLCLACHATHGPFEPLTPEMIAEYAANLDTIATVVSTHTHHPYDPENNDETGGSSRCIKCHLPKVANSAVNYDIHSHTFEPIPPEKTIEFAMPHSCAASCHRNPEYAEIPGFGIVDGDLADWSEATDVALADTMMYYYGPNGIWWQTVGIEDDETGGSLLPKTYALGQNYPNPFNPSTTLRYEVPNDSKVELVVYDIHGRKVRALISGQRKAGQHSVTWDGRNEAGVRVASGVYLYRLSSESFAETRKMVLLK